MVMEKGQSSSSSKIPKRKRYLKVKAEANAEPKKRSPLTLTTLKIMKEKASRRVNTRKPGATTLYFDNTDDGYRWLLPGWVAEERIVPSGRLYRYFYDRSGFQYHSQRELLSAWEQSGMVCLDF